MIDRNFDNAVARRRGAHLHFQIPAIGFLLHAERAQAIGAQGAERRHVGEAHAISDAQQQPGDPAGDDLLRRHAARLAMAAQA